ncbi:putative RNA methyltransferase [Pseudomassariella vexata]|uniref:Putative RNA methyltransferase n=1 Tax=Pseudomassariella vexata TaxID=1141098 RepID=A0A1Y2D621_9PEZI|nr:putative RNA methyltransferase [Pseudomassariella vexata]ORY54731.1 putative RNA methyltransferase [Pseudomassariella vexata]
MAYYEQDRSKKRKVSRDGEYVDTSKPSAFFQPSSGREWSISIAIPGSVILNCRRDDQRYPVIGHLARALAVFGIDEIVIFDDSPMDKRPRNVDSLNYTGDTDPCGYIEHLLNYLEIPPFMRKTLMPLHPNLRGAGLLPSLDIPSHPHPSEWLPYREGVTAGEDGGGTLVDVGGKEQVYIAEKISPNTRITLQIDENDPSQAKPVHPDAPRTEGGYYWGYSVRRANSLSAVFEECKYDGGYDMSIGTSERGTLIPDSFPEKKQKDAAKFKHLIIIFGGPRGIEYAAENDPALQEMGIIRGKTKDLFDHWINVLPGQSSRTIRTDEAVYIGLTSLRRIWDGR